MWRTGTPPRASGPSLGGRLDLDADRFGVGELDEIAHLGLVEVLRVPYGERPRVAARPLQADRVVLLVDADDLGRDLGRLGDHAARLLARLRALDALGLLDARLGLAGLPQVERQRLVVGDAHDVATTYPVEVPHVRARREDDLLAVGADERHLAALQVDVLHRGRHGDHLFGAHLARLLLHARGHHRVGRCVDLAASAREERARERA